MAPFHLSLNLMFLYFLGFYFFLRSSHEGPLQALLQSGRKHSLLSAQGSSDWWHAVWPRHQRHLCARPVQGECFFFLRCSITPSWLVWHVLQWWLVLTFLHSMNPSPFLLFVEDSVPLDVAWVYVSKVPPQTVIHSALELSSLPYLHCVSAASGLWPYFKLQGQER